MPIANVTIAANAATAANPVGITRLNKQAMMEDRMTCIIPSLPIHANILFKYFISFSC